MRNREEANMRVAICDDEEKDLLALKEAVNAFDPSGLLDVFAFSSATALYLEEKRKKFDVAILDIEMAPPNGYDIAKKLAESDPAPIIIFLTKSMAYTLRGYGIAFRYLTKPIDQCLLNNALAAAVKEASAKRFVFSMEGSSYVIRMEDIYYFEVFNHHTILHTMDQAYTFRATLKEIMAELPAGYFGSPHQSYIINFSHVKSVMAKEINLTNGANVPISRRKQQEFDNQLRTYLRR